MINKFILQRSYKKLLNILTFVDLPIRQKFLLFSIGSLFWLMIISAIGLVTMVNMNDKSRQMVDSIVPQEKTASIVIRKLRGASISAHKILIYKDPGVINSNYLRGKARIEDCRSYLNILLTGGRIKDYSRGTGQLYNEFAVAPLRDDTKIQLIKGVLPKFEELESYLDEITRLKLSSKSADSEQLQEKLSRYDALTREIVTIVNEYSISMDKEWKDFARSIKMSVNVAMFLIVVTFVIAAILSAVFGVLISRALAKPVRAIINQIKTLSAGELNLTRKLEVLSKDELGVLSHEFNHLMDTIQHVNSFKKVIEEDESIEDIYLRLGKVFSEDLKLDNCVIYEVSPTKNTMRIVFPPEAEGMELNCKMEMQIDSDLCRAKRTGHMVSAVDYPQVCKYFTGGLGEVHICIPIIVGGNVGGVVQFVCGRPDQCEITDMNNRISRAKQYISEVQPVLEAKRLMKTLRESSVKDAMTGLYNRRFLEETFESLTAGTVRRGSTLGLLMCDLDFFKQTNDTYGHDAGDAVLKETASTIRKSVRSSDIVIRFGGEEFLVLVVDVKPGESEAIAEKIRQRIEETKVKVAGNIIQKTISIGVSEFPGDTHNFWETVKFADVALYKAKESGRNRVMRFTADMWVEDKY